MHVAGSDRIKPGPPPDEHLDARRLIGTGLIVGHFSILQVG
jgi:hypothetical protein